jgi:hypothetical protein
MNEMNDTQIDHLIAARNAVTDRTEDYPNLRAVSYIDAVLSDIPIGQRPDVDALLGRRAGYIINPAVMLEQIRQGERDWNDIKGDLAL